MVYTYNEILLSNKKESTIDTYKNMGKSPKYNGEQKKTDKTVLLYDLIYVKF